MYYTHVFFNSILSGVAMLNKAEFRKENQSKIDIFHIANH